MSNCLFHASIPGRVGIKKNGKRVFRKSIVSSERFLVWEKYASLICNSERVKQKILKPHEDYCTALYLFKFKNRQNEIDTSNGVEGIADIMQKVGIIKDDRLIKNFYAEKILNCETDSLEVYLFKYQDLFNFLGEKLCIK